MKEITKEWLTKAEKDFRVAEREFKLTPPEYEAVCFHSQQCVEKYLKAILQENDIYFEKIHDLRVLSEKCIQFIPELSKYLDELDNLSSFAVEIRYPGTEADREDAMECLNIAREIRKISREYFELSEE